MLNLKLKHNINNNLKETTMFTLDSYTPRVTRLNKEDIIQAFKDNGGEFSCYLDSNGNMLGESTSLNATHYGESDDSIPCDAELKVFDNLIELKEYLNNSSLPKSHDYTDMFEHDKDFKEDISFSSSISSQEVVAKPEPAKEPWTPTIHNTGYMGCFDQYMNWKVKKLSPINQNRDIKYTNETNKLNWAIKTLNSIKSEADNNRLKGLIRFVKSNIHTESSLKILRREYINTTWRLHQATNEHTYIV